MDEGMARALYGELQEFDAAAEALYMAGPGKATIHGWAGVPEGVKICYRHDAKMVIDAHHKAQSLAKVDGAKHAADPTPSSATEA